MKNRLLRSRNNFYSSSIFFGKNIYLVDFTVDVRRGGWVGGWVSVCLCFVVGLIPLNRRCEASDRCADPAASCYSGFCLCHVTHYELSNRCGA